MEEGTVSKPVAVLACAAMAVLYVAILYAPTLLLRLPHPSSLKSFMIRRFICAAISSLLSFLLSSLILPMRSVEVWELLSAYGVRADHIWQSVAFPLSLTCLMYAGSLVLKTLLLIDSCRRYTDSVGGFSFDCANYALRSTLDRGISVAYSVLAWRNYVVAPLTEELVFRASHLNHLMEVYNRQNYNLIKAALAVALQLGYTLVFGSYASFLFIRTGIVSVAFLAGLLGFLWLLFPMTNPDLYNDRTSNCRCWHGYCSWR
ncbi:hypothetical protein L484_015414 [Morus notabilis]|uniref:CAAX prenyl protease 2 n=1 Tax=Morus notabilis TaxID=981085 RepID=W9RG59_9ROSA|nr:hypothetical protein L484_015414 [Morus notabilis]